ncbi:hypothetical protein [Flexivirga caeni]|nr:hypothetical protein [Flexivirga caeni]
MGYVLKESVTVYWGAFSATLVTPAAVYEQATADSRKSGDESSSSSGSDRSGGTSTSNGLAAGSADPIATAAALAILANRGQPVVRAASPDATLYGDGETSAVQAQVRNVGGQWVTSVPAPIIDVQVVEPTAARAQADLKAEMAKLNASLTELQDRFRVRPSNRMTLTFAPSAPTAEIQLPYKTRALAASALAGLMGTVTLVYWVDVWRRGPRKTDRHGQAVAA